MKGSRGGEVSRTERDVAVNIICLNYIYRHIRKEIKNSFYYKLGGSSTVCTVVAEVL